MKIIYQHETVERKNSEVCVVTEYSTIDHSIDFAIVNISGQYPAEKRAVNRICKEMVYVAKGNGEVIVEDKSHPINMGDLILIESGEKFVWRGHMTLHISCRPAFTKEQHQIVD